jgi:tRNA 2-thiouridine synthesizing protein A
MKTVDARGLSCPQPVLMTLEKIKENVTRAATSKGWSVKEIQSDGSEYRITIEKG